jgi:hypothetical protein
MILKPEPVGSEKYYLDERFVDVPVFTEDQLPPGYCARFARLAADHIFGKKYPVSDAWCMREQSGVLAIPVNSRDVPLFADKVILAPGMVVGVRYNNSTISDGNMPYTHVGLYIGKHNGKPVFLEQFLNEIRVSKLSDLSREFEVREILKVR